MAQNVAEEILRRRPFFLVTTHHQDYDFSSASTVGLFWSERNALLCGLKHLLLGLDYNHYDPSKRFYMRRSHWSADEGVWEDQWSRYCGHCEYKIEEIFPETSGAVQTKFIGFDAFVKDLVISTQMSSHELRVLLTNWRSEVAAGTTPHALEACLRQEVRRNRQYSGSRESWVERHGSIAPYPHNKGTYEVDEL